MMGRGRVTRRCRFARQRQRRARLRALAEEAGGNPKKRTTYNTLDRLHGGRLSGYCEGEGVRAIGEQEKAG